MWVLDRKACEELGLTKGQIKSKVQRGIWTRGKHFCVEDRQTWINMDEVQKWVQRNCQEGLNYIKENCDTEKSSMESGTQRKQTSRPLKVI